MSILSRLSIRFRLSAAIAVLFGLILTLLFVPVFALFWGARLTDLTEMWDSFARGFAIGDSRISPTDFLTFAVIFVIGDACIAGAMPKSGFSANSQAKVAAMNLRGDLVKSKVFPAKYSNTCWSLIDTDDGVKVGAQYAPQDGKIASTSKFISQTGEDAGMRKATYEESVGWYAGITKDMFG